MIIVLAVVVHSARLQHPNGHSKSTASAISNKSALPYRLWEGDNNDKYPMAVSVTNGGAMELVATGNVAACFQVMSNELSTPKILICPEDTHRDSCNQFCQGFNNSNISYFVGLDVTNETNPQMFLSGDDNFAIGGIPVKSRHDFDYPVRRQCSTPTLDPGTVQIHRQYRPGRRLSPANHAIRWLA